MSFLRRSQSASRMSFTGRQSLSSSAGPALKEAMLYKRAVSSKSKAWKHRKIVLRCDAVEWYSRPADIAAKGSLQLSADSTVQNWHEEPFCVAIKSGTPCLEYRLILRCRDAAEAEEWRGAIAREINALHVERHNHMQAQMGHEPVAPENTLASGKPTTQPPAPSAKWRPPASPETALAADHLGRIAEGRRIRSAAEDRRADGPPR